MALLWDVDIELNLSASQLRLQLQNGIQQCKLHSGFSHSHSIVSEKLFLDCLKRCCINLDDDILAGKTNIPSGLSPKRIRLFFDTAIAVIC
jgi:hypothetical protein